MYPDGDISGVDEGRYDSCLEKGGMLHALSVGINRHADAQVPPLRFARTDAEAVVAVLEERLGAGVNATLLVEEEATKAAIAHAMTAELPRRLSAADTVLLYFAVHGCPEIDAEATDRSLHLLTADTDYAKLFATSINLVSELCEWTRRLPARLVFVVLDTSFAGAGGGRTIEGPGLRFGLRLRHRAHVSPSKLSIGSHCAFLMACGDLESVHEDTTLRHGALTHGFVGALRRAKTSEDLQPSQLHRDVSLVVRAGTQGAQNPVLMRGSNANVALFGLPDARWTNATFSRAIPVVSADRVDLASEFPYKHKSG